MPRTERPLVSDGSALLEFAAELRALRQQAGTPPYRELARRAHFSATTLSDAAGGRRLPTLAVTLAYVRACGGDAAEWERRWTDAAVESAVESADVEDSGAGQAPYVGLAAYEVEDADRFHGREALVDHLVEHVARHRFVTVVGPSGAGKSSLLRAGLIPRFRSTGAAVVLFTPGAHPVEECAIQLARLLGATPGVIAAELDGHERGLHRLVRQLDGDVVLVVDQFEEVFTLCRDARERARFMELLIEAADHRCAVVIGVRADFYGHCLLNPDLVDRSRAALVPVGPMTVDELRRAIVEPALLAGCMVEGALLTTLVAQSAGQEGALPLLSHALRETWRYRKGNTLTLTGYQRTGGIDGALARTAEGVFAALEAPQRTAARNLFLRLVELGEGTRDTKRRVPRAEFDRRTDEVLTRFTAARLLVLTDRDVEIAHEALIDGWPRLRDWLAEDRDGQRVQRQLTEATATWLQLDRDHSALLRGGRLAVIGEWARRRSAPTETEREFLDASTAAEERERRGVRRRGHLLRALVVLLVALLVITTTTANRANRQRDAAVALHAIGVAEKLIDSDPALAARISLVAYRLYPVRATRESLISTSAAATAIPLNALSRHLAIHPDGGVVAAADPSSDTTVLSSITAGEPVVVAQVPGGAQPAVFSHRGSMMATVDRAGVVRLWRMGEGLLAVLPVAARDVHFSEHGDLMVTTDVSRGTAGGGPPSRVWDLSDPRRPRHLAPLPGAGTGVFAFSGDNRMIATVDRSAGTTSIRVLLWDLIIPTAPRLIGRIYAPGTIDAAFVDRNLVTMTNRGDLTIWNTTPAAGAHRTATLNGYSPTHARFAPSPDGRLIGTAGLDAVNAVWDTTTSGIAVELRRPRDFTLAQLAFTRDGEDLLPSCGRTPRTTRSARPEAC